MKPQEYTIRITQNSAWQLRVTYSDDQDPPVPFDLSTYAGEFVIRTSMDADTAIVRTQDIDFGSSTDNVIAKLTATQTDELPTNNELIEDDWVYALLIWDTNDQENTQLTLLQGSVEVYPNAGRPDNT